MKKAKCVYCNCEKEYEVLDEKYVYVEDELKVKYNGKKAICRECKNELMIDEIEKYNQEQFEKEYKRMNNIITTEEIKQIIDKYNIGKRPLSLVLGLGEITITRYLEGFVPTLKNSIYLKKILEFPEEYYALLQKNKNAISPLAFKKSKLKCDEILGIDVEDTTLRDIGGYMINKGNEITPLSLQKLLYYVQLLSLMFLGKKAFNNICEAWEHGPVYRDIYFDFKKYGCNPIDNKEVKHIDLEKEIKRIVDCVLKTFGCYSGNVLTYFTHSEDPWKITKNSGLEVISIEKIKEYGEKIKKEYNVKRIEDIDRYIEKMLKKYKLKIRKESA